MKAYIDSLNDIKKSFAKDHVLAYSAFVKLILSLDNSRKFKSLFTKDFEELTYAVADALYDNDAEKVEQYFIVLQDRLGDYYKRNPSVPCKNI